MSIHAHHTAHLYRYIRFVRVLPRGCTLGFALWGEGELQLVGGTRVINGVATQSRPRAPSPLTQCAQGFSPSRACLSSRLFDIYMYRKWPLPLRYIIYICERTNERTNNELASSPVTHTHKYVL